MEINERDYEFMLKVREAYEKSMEGGEGSVRAVAAEFNISRTKVRKILITLGVIGSDITEKALTLKERGMSLERIAGELGCSVATVSTYLPYDTVFYKGEEKSSVAIRLEKYRERNKRAAEKQIQRNKNTGKERDENMKNREFAVIRLRLELNIEGADVDVLKKYGKVKEGITREILVPADMNLHALHYVIQKAFGWQNGHLHHFSLPDGMFDKLTRNNFLKWADYCGIYFRFPTDDTEDLYWDDDYDESVSVKTWMRRKYNGAYQYRGICEHFMEARRAVRKLIEENPVMRVAPSFSEWSVMSEAERRYLRTNPRIKKIADVTCEEMREYFMDEGGIDELLERLKITEILGEEAEEKQLDDYISSANKRFEENCVDIDIESPYNRSYRKKIGELDGTALPIAKELVYEYDYGDGWEVRITYVDEYCCGSACDSPDKSGAGPAKAPEEQVIDDMTPIYGNGESIEGALWNQIITVITEQRPLCIALDGLPVLDDVGGIFGYCEMLTGIHGKGAEHFDYDDPEETKEWARMQGWTGRMNTPEKLL